MKRARIPVALSIFIFTSLSSASAESIASHSRARRTPDVRIVNNDGARVVCGRTPRGWRAGALAHGRFTSLATRIDDLRRALRSATPSARKKIKAKIAALRARAVSEDAICRTTPNGQPTPKPSATPFIVVDTPQATPSPTPTPPLPAAAGIFSTAWKERWQRARTEHHPWADLLISNAERSATSDARYADAGNWGTIAYQLSGDLRYAEKAWAQLAASGFDVQGPNELREDLTERALIYYGLRDYLARPENLSKRSQFISSMNAWSDRVIEIVSERRNDSDATVGSLGIFLWALVSANENAQASRLLATPVLGGLTPTGDNDDTVRNAIKRFATSARGGEWIESSDYNLGTMKLLLLATEGIRTVTAIDYFPEVTALYNETALAGLHQITSDLSQSLQWGDVEHPRDFVGRLFNRITLLGMLEGVTASNPNVGPYVQQLLVELRTKYAAAGAYAEPWARLYYLYDPFLAGKDFRLLPPVHDASGMGFTFFRDDWKPDGTFVSLLTHNPPAVDHQMPSATDFQLYRKGEWALTNPIGYATGVLSDNGIVVAGFGTMSEATGRLAQEVGASNSYLYSVGTTAGNFAYPDYWNPPDTFVHEATRSFFYLPSAHRDSSTLIMFDRVNVDAPSGAGNWYQDDWQTASTSPRKQIVFHAPVSPSTSGTTMSWSTEGGQAVSIATLTPGITRVVTKATAQLIGGYIYPEEYAGYVVSIRPATVRKWDTFLTIATVSDSGVSRSAARIVSQGGEAEGALISRSGEHDAVAIFNARQGPDRPKLVGGDGRIRYDADLLAKTRDAMLHRASFTFSFSSGTETTDLFVFDLDPSLHWSVKVGTETSQLPVSAAGLARLAVHGAGSRTVEIVRMP